MRVVDLLSRMLHLPGARPSRETDPEMLEIRRRQHALLNREQTLYWQADARVKRLETEVEVRRIGANDVGERES